MPGGLEASPVWSEKFVSIAVEVRGNDHQQAAWLENAITLADELEGVVNVLNDMVHCDRIEGLWRKPDVLERPYVYRDIVDVTSVGGGRSIYLLTIDLPTHG